MLPSSCNVIHICTWCLHLCVSKHEPICVKCTNGTSIDAQHLFSYHRMRSILLATIGLVISRPALKTTMVSKS